MEDLGSDGAGAPDSSAEGRAGQLSAEEALVLAYLLDRGGDEYAFGFATIGGDLWMGRAAVRAACRSLADRGLTRFCRGLMNDEGMLMGSGYACRPAAFGISGLPDWMALADERAALSKAQGEA